MIGFKHQHLLTLGKGYVNMVQVSNKLIQNSRMWVEKYAWDVEK